MSFLILVVTVTVSVFLELTNNNLWIIGTILLASTVLWVFISLREPNPNLLRRLDQANNHEPTYLVDGQRVNLLGTISGGEHDGQYSFWYIGHIYVDPSEWDQRVVIETETTQTEED